MWNIGRQGTLSLHHGRSTLSTPWIQASNVRWRPHADYIPTGGPIPLAMVLTLTIRISVGVGRACATTVRNDVISLEVDLDKLDRARVVQDRGGRCYTSGFVKDLRILLWSSTSGAAHCILWWVMARQTGMANKVAFHKLSLVGTNSKPQHAMKVKPLPCNSAKIGISSDCTALV